MPSDASFVRVNGHLNTGAERGATAVDVSPRTASRADRIKRLGQFLNSARRWFFARPTWGKVLLVLLLTGLLPWLLIAVA